MIKFEIWYQEKINDRNVKELFYESCMCYKVGAYRAAYIMSYLAFQNVLKNRVLKFEGLPKDMPKKQWEEITNKLKDDKTWDEEVFQCVIMKKPTNPFVISDDLRKQYEYFRGIRNDCAHAKSNIIGAAHVEVLWLFIQSNYNRFTVNGGKEGLLERVKNYYNINLTKPNSPIMPIIDDIKNSMKSEEIPSFFTDVYKFMKDELFCSYFAEYEETGGFWNGIVNSADSDLINALFSFVKSNDDIFLNFIDSYPDELIKILSDSEPIFTRRFWNETIFKMVGSYKYQNEWKVIEILLSSDIIPSEERDRFIKKLVNKKAIPSESTVDYFKSIGYIDLLRDSFFENGNNFNAPYGIDYANNNWSIISFLILNSRLDLNMVTQLNRLLKSSSYGIFHDGTLKLLINNKDILDKFKTILDQNGIELAQSIIELEN